MIYRVNLVQILRSENIGWMGLLEVVWSNLLLKGLFYINILISVIAYDNFLKQVINRCMLDSQKTDINTPSSYLASSFLFLVFKYDLNQ